MADEHHHQGIGTLLLEHLAAAARRVAVSDEFDAEVLAENGAAPCRSCTTSVSTSGSRMEG